MEQSVTFRKCVYKMSNNDHDFIVMIKIEHRFSLNKF